MTKQPCTASAMIRYFSTAVDTHLPALVEVDQLSYWKMDGKGSKKRMNGQDPGWPFKPGGPFLNAIP